MSQRARPRSLAAFVAFSTLLASAGSPILAQSRPSLTGRVLAENGVAARPGVVVALVDTSAETVFRSKPTDERGAFRVDAPAAGKYALLVEAPEGAFLASSGLELKAGENRPVALALKPGKDDPGTPPASGSNPPPAKGGLPTWAKWVIAGGIVVGAAIVVDAVTSDDKEASQF